MRDRFLLKIFLILLLVFTSSTVAYSQYNSEEELKKAADKFFAEENYIEALPLFSQLLSTYPKDLNYNYKYGACYLYATRDKEKAINYLSFAASRPNVDPLAYYYLAKAYHHNYEFASAIVYFNKYKGKTSSKEHQQYEIDRQIEMCKNGQQLLKKINKIGVISKKEIKESEFFRSYDLRGLQGKVIVKPDEFKMKMDKKQNEYSILYSDPNLNVVVFSSYGDKGSNKDIYKIEKIGINQFSDPISLGDVINTPFDEDYAFLHPDGKTLYFSSKGHNSMGGYDIFKSIYDKASDTWSTPVNLDFPINTPDDDILYISDIDNQLAYFASSRASKQNELTVYKVKVEPEPLHNPLIKGLFVSEENPSLKNATISIVDAMDNTKYGVYNTDENSGEYLLTFPADEKKYKLIVETTNDAPIHSAIIELPKMTEFKLLKQELFLVGTGDNEKLVIKNLFDQEDEFDISNPIIVQNLLKQQAKLDVNISEEDALKSINDGSSTLAANETSDAEYADYSDDKLKTVANKKIEDMLQKTEKSEEEKDFYFNYAATKTNEAKNQYNQDTKNKDVVAEDVNSASLALKLARVTQNEAVERNSDKPKLLEYQQKLEAAISSGNRSEAELIMAEIEKIENAAYFENSAVEVETKLADENLKTAKADYQKQRDIVIGYTNRKLELEKSIAAIESQIEATKKAKDKEALQDQLATYKIDLEDLEFQIEKSKAKELLAKQAFDKAKNEASLLANVVDAAKKQTTTSPSLDNQAILATESTIRFFDEEGVLGYYPATSSSTSTSSTSGSLVAMKDDYEIIDDNGNLIDYNSKYTNQVDENENNPAAIVDINKQWITAIEEDIEIKNSLKNSATTVGEKEELSKIITQLETLKQQKEEEIDLQTNLALQNETNNASSNENTVADNNNNTANTTKTSKTSTKKYETSIIDKDGNVIDYNAQFLEELEQLPADEQTAKLFAQKAEIYNKWADATEQEITLKKIELVEADANEAPEIQEDLDELASDLQDKQEFTALFLTQAKALAATEDELAYVEDIENKIAGNNIESNELASNETSNNNQNNTTSSNQKVNAAQYNNIKINNDGSVNDYATEYENQLADLELRSDNKVKISEEQVAVTTNWIEAIDEEIAYQNERLIATDDENEKATIENRIADLKEQKSNQIAQLNTFQTELIAAKSTATNETTNEVAVNETATSNTTSQNQVSKENSSLTYNSTTAKNMLANVDELTEEVNALRVKADNTEDEAYKTQNTTEKEEKLAEAEEINNQANDKEIEITTLYERANSTEFKDNQTTVNTLLKSIGGQSTDNNYIMAEMLNDESVTLFNEASDARQQAVATNNFKQKKDLLDEAAKLEKEAIEKQQNAIGLLEQISTSSSIAATNNNQNNTEEDVIAEETTTNNNQQTNNNNTEEDILVEETTITNNNQQATINNQASINNRKSSTNNNQQQVTVYEPKNIELPSKERKQDAIQLEKEAITLNQEAKQLDETAENTKNRKEKQALVEEAKQKREEADRKAKEAEVIYAEVKEMEAEEELYLEELATQRKELVATVLTPEEESYVQSLTPEEKAAITNTPEFKEYKELKQSSRRLVKEAQVEYIAADKAKEEADDQKQLGVALQALQQAAATEADKNKLANQMKKLEDMIAQNEQKAIELREQATAKEQQALEENKKANTMVANKDENSALGFVALEKTNDTSDEMLADYAKEVNSSLPENQRRQQANNKTEEDVLAEETTTNNNQQTTNSQQQTNNNTEEDVITEETTTNNNQQTTNNQQQTNNTEEDVIAEESIINNNNQQTTNNTPQSTNNQQSIANIDEIPQELTESIFAITSPNESAYNENKRIPKNPKLPEGLVFKVQIGAFRNPIPQDHYKGFAPLMAEDAGNGITRYTAGLFKTFNVANMAKNEIRTMGYPDAFVVAFFNGKRININEARAMLAETPTTEEEISFTNTNQTNNQQPSNNNQTTNNNKPITTEEVKDGISKDVRNIEGVFYTIQVGVYSKPITADQLNNLTPLNSERTANGLIRYTSGIYKNLNDANTAKNRAVNLGITDAFIIAYQNGNKITVAQANELLGSNNSTPANNNTTEVEVTNENASSNNNTSENNTSTVENDNATSTNTTTTNENNEAPNETVETTNTNEETTITNEEPIVTSKPKTDKELRQVAESLNIVFKVKIGEFTDEISNEDAAVLLKLSDRNIENFVDGDKTIYTIGNLLDYKSALNTQLEMKEMGVKSPSVVAFKNSTIIPVEEALELIKNVE